MVDGRNFFDQPTKMIQKHIIAISIIKDFNWSRWWLHNWIFTTLIGISNDETNFPHKLLLTNKEISKIHQLIQTFQKFYCLKLYNVVHLMNLFHLKD